jgi:hypothetical protein
MRCPRISTGIVAVALLGTACAGPSGHGSAGRQTGHGGVGRGTASHSGADQSGAGQGGGSGVVTGRLLREGGALRAGGRQPGERPIRGTVRFSAGGRRLATVRVGASGTFSVTLPPGRYAVSGSTPEVMEVTSRGTRRQDPCARGVPATVRAGRVTRITVTCIVP